MDNFLKVIFANFLLIFLFGCTQLLEPVSLNLNNSQANSNKVDEQDSFDIRIKTLTLKEAKKNKNAPYKRELIVDGAGNNANVYLEDTFMKSNFPNKSRSEEYVLGLGDELTFVLMQSMDNYTYSLSLGTNAPVNESIDNVISSKGIIGTDGTVLLLGVGLINAGGRTINDIRSEIRNILTRSGIAPNFQLEISGFESKQAYIFTEAGRSMVLKINSRATSLKELVAKAGFSPNRDQVSIISLKRDGNTYRISTDSLFNDERSEFFIEDGDQINIKSYEYKPGKVFALTGSNGAQIIPINPSNRETMADILFEENGPLSNQFAKRSEIYLLRGKQPVTAYHLDGQNVSRIIVANEMQVRPDDIIFTAERPIISFSRVLSEISPLRTLLRDAIDNNLP